MNTEWTFEEMLDCAAGCSSYRSFIHRFPLVYSSARSRGWLSAVIQHGGWEKNGNAAAYTVPLAQPLNTILNESGSLLPDVLWDPMWPVEIEEHMWM